MKKTIIALLTVLFISSFMFGCSSSNGDGEDKAEDKWAAIEERGTVIVGLDDTFVPMGFKDGNGEIVGFDVDLAKEAISRMGLEAEFQPIDWNLKETELNSGNIDLIWNGYTITDARKEKVNFTNPYLDNRQVIVVLSGSDIETKADLEGRVVAAQNASSALDAIESEGAGETFDGGEPILFDTYNDAFMDLEAGRVHAVVADEILARYYISERGEDKYAVLADDFGDEEYGIGVRKSDETLLSKLNDALDDMKADGTAAEISEEWFSENIVK
ncbi:transporter substrate-binding domain-containing protein [Alkalibacter mobilis]|uniref:transporter substrate-binding domain-containing protein n=1 Tax=Alkalibacter mobilis TaxID=2787712 RepID=UPI00189D8A9A|nr:transporter substrate-binding domain-containing protein [Alkalibacter mobilis]MBF7096181.1 transporter substrate-binding domain-containing protein [Alkalibacter mobilis]